jgi:hypothetical protein
MSKKIVLLCLVVLGLLVSFSTALKKNIRPYQNRRPYENSLHTLSASKNKNELSDHLKQLDNRFGIINLARVRNGKRSNDNLEYNQDYNLADRFVDSFEKYWEDGEEKK